MNRTLLILCFTLFTLTAGEAFSQAPAPAPPAAKKIPRSQTLHGDTRVDHYFWLRERENPEVRKHIEAENAYTAEIMKPLEPFVESLFREMVSRIMETDQTPPYREGGWYYYSRTEKGKQYPIFCRRKGSVCAPEEVYFDQNKMAKGFPFYSVWHMQPSPDGNILAYSIDTSGAENYVLHFKDLVTGKILADRVENTQDFAWAADSRTILYTVEDSTRRPYRVFRHVLGTDPAKDPLVYEEKDTLYIVKTGSSRDHRYLFVGSSATNSDEWRAIPADRPADTPILITPRRSGHEYEIDCHGGDFYIRTNSGAPTFRLVRAPAAEPGEKNWKEVIPGRREVTLEGMDFFSRSMVIYEREKGLQKIRFQDLATGEVHYLDFPEPVYTVVGQVNRVFDTSLFRFTYQSLTRPPATYDYDMVTRKKELVKEQEVPGGYYPSLYQAERLFAKAPDGASIPISLVYKKGVKRDGTTPLHLTGYGAYGASREPAFSTARLSYLDRGVIFAIAHVRGGADMGREWYEDGKLLKKKNSFTDFIACAEHLIASQYTCSRGLTISGGSAGGLLMGAVTTMRPDLFRAVIASVPFVDVVNTMLDPTLMYTEQEYLEWGNPREKIYYDYMKSYDPYENVKACAYPDILVRVGFNDPRVNYWEGAKWAAKLRALKTGDTLVLLKVDMGQGHMGSTGRYDRLKDAAFDYAWVLSRCGIVK